MGTQTATMDFIYPKPSKFYLTKNFNRSPACEKVAHSQRKAFGMLIMCSKAVRNLFMKCLFQTTGFHYITVVDEFGNEILED
jgi:penicillin-binding protein 1C